MSHIPRTCSHTDSSHRKLRIVMIGDSGAGKSSIVARFVDDKFDLNLIHTIGIDFRGKRIEIGDKSVQLQLWDTAGQERFHSVTPAYCRNADGVVLVYDIANFKSFNNIGFWIGQVKENAPPNVKFLLLGNKKDLEDGRIVSKEMGREAARRIEACFFEVSAFTGFNVDCAFEEFARIILASQGVVSSKRASLVESIIRINPGLATSRPRSKSTAKSCCLSST